MMRSWKDIPIPKRMRKLPRERRGYPVPFVTMLDPFTDEPDFRVLDVRRQMQCIKEKRCAICGEPLTRYIAFIGGPRSRDGHVFFDPGMHRECAEYASVACPFISRENATYRDITEEDREKYAMLVNNQDEHRERPEMFMVITQSYTAQSNPGIGLVIIAGEYTEVVQIEQHRPIWG
jgi:hypothetical protein